MTAFHSGASRDPIVGGVQPGFQVVVSHDARRRVVADADDLDAAQRHEALTGRLVSNLNDLPAAVRAAILAREMRPLGLVTLGAKHGGHVAKLPVGRAPAAGLAARRLPF